MRIHNKKEGLWFVFQARTSAPGPDESGDEIIVCSFENLITYGGMFSWVDDMRGIFTARKEAEKFAKGQKVRS